MNPICFWWRRALALYAAQERPLAEGSRLAAHLSRCRACRAFWRDIHNLAANLPRVCSAPAPSGDFTDSVWRRIDSAPRRHHPGVPAPLLAASAAALAALFGFLWWRTAVPSNSEQPEPFPVAKRPQNGFSPGPSSVPGGVSRTQRVASAPSSSGPKKERTRASASRKRGAATTPKRPSKDRIRRRMMHRIRYAQTPVREMAKIASSVVPHEQAAARWQKWGAWFEIQGDYQRAAAAYQRAFEIQPDPEVGFAAGRAAECAGDISEALRFYSRILYPPSGSKERPEDGATRWNATHNAV